MCLAYSPNFDVVISADTKGVMDYWSPLADDHRVPDGVTKFRYELVDRVAARQLCHPDAARFLETIV